MSYRVCNGYVCLPSRYGPSENFQHHLDAGRWSPRWFSKDLGNSRHGLDSSRSPGLSELEKNIEAAGYIETDNWTGQWRDYTRAPLSPRQTDRARSVSPLRGIHSLESYSKMPVNTVFSRNLSSPPISRRSPSRLSSWSAEEPVMELPLSRRGWSGSETDLRASLSESAQKRSDLVQHLREAQGKLEEQSEEIRKRDKELELSRAKTELLAIKQKQLEASISQLEKEKGWLEVSRFEDKKQRGELQDRIINLEMEVMLAKSSLENLNYTNELTIQKSSLGNDEVNRELKTARENLVYFRNRVKVLEAEKNNAIEELRKLREGSRLALSQANEANGRVTDTLRNHQNMQEELTDLQLNFNNINLEKELLSSKAMRLEEKVSDLSLRLKIAQSDKERFMQEKLELHRRTQELSLELERAKRGHEGFNDQFSDLHIELVDAKAQANRQDQEKVQMKEELLMLKQVNEKMNTELGQTQQTLQGTLEELHQIQAEHKITSNLSDALEAERKQLLEEKQLLMAAVENDDESQLLQELRESQQQLHDERDKLNVRCSELEAALEQAHEQLGSQIQEQQQITLYWKERWQQTAVNLKNAEELLEQEKAQCRKAAERNTALLQDCEILQADREELPELQAAVSRLKEENSQLSQQMKEMEQTQHLQNLHKSTVSQTYMFIIFLIVERTGNDSFTTVIEENKGIPQTKDRPEEMIAQVDNVYKELQQAQDCLQMNGKGMPLLIACYLHSEKIKLLEREKSDKETEIRKLKSENGSVLQIELDACRQQLELERSRREELQIQVAELESKLTEDRKSQELEDLKCKKPEDIKASLEEVDTELVQVREELQKVWDMLRTKDTELEEQYQELESARDQYTECSTEKVRLEQLVTSLQKQVEDKVQELRHLQQLREMEKTEMAIERSSMELKMAEIQEQCENATSTNIEQKAPTGNKNLSPKSVPLASGPHKCARCDVFLQQIETVIKGCQERNVELQEEKNQTLSVLYQLQDILKDLSKQTKVNKQVAKTIQVDNDTLKQQHKLVTEQLKGLFKEKKQLSNAYEKFPKEEKPADDWTIKSRLVKNVLNSVKRQTEDQGEVSKERTQHEELQNLSGESEENVHNLQKLLKEKTEKMSTMASEIKTLREKNESLMKAKLRFQQQVQQIRSISQPRLEKEPTDPTVPRLSEDPKYSYKDSDQESCSQETLMAGTQTPEGSWTGYFQNSRSSTPISSNTTASSPFKLNLPGTMGKSWRNSTEGSPLSPRSNADSEAPLTPRASALLSPRPYQPRNTKQLHKFGEN
ncbi:uncharacterized protein PAF06_009660 [Gastrophryne carolinensis]